MLLDIQVVLHRVRSRELVWNVLWRRFGVAASLRHVGRIGEVHLRTQSVDAREWNSAARAFLLDVERRHAPSAGAQPGLVHGREKETEASTQGHGSIAHHVPGKAQAGSKILEGGIFHPAVAGGDVLQAGAHHEAVVSDDVGETPVLLRRHRDEFVADPGGHGQPRRRAPLVLEVEAHDALLQASCSIQAACRDRAAEPPDVHRIEILDVGEFVTTRIPRRLKTVEVDAVAHKAPLKGVGASGQDHIVRDLEAVDSAAIAALAVPNGRESAARRQIPKEGEGRNEAQFFGDLRRIGGMAVWPRSGESQPQ